MANYKIIYNMIDGATHEVVMNDRPDKIDAITEQLTSTKYTSHISPDETAALVINNRNILSMEVYKV